MKELPGRPSLYDVEPTPARWEAVDDDDLRMILAELLPDTPTHLILIDGRSGSGKSTFARKVAELLHGQIVHTDDIAWHLDIINWDRELIQGVIEPWREGKHVSYRPPGWIRMGREGSVEATPSPILIVEGVGAGRESLAGLADLVIWVQADNDKARARGIERDMQQTDRREPAEAERFWDEWMATETPYLNGERPWERAKLIVNGTPPENAGVTYIAAGPLREGV